MDAALCTTSSRSWQSRTFFTFTSWSWSETCVFFSSSNPNPNPFPENCDNTQADAEADADAEAEAGGGGRHLGRDEADHVTNPMHVMMKAFEGSAEKGG